MAKNKTKFRNFYDVKAEHKAAKDLEYSGKYDNGAPATIKIDVQVGSKSPTTGEYKLEKREFMIDNKLSIRRALNDIVLIDMSKIELDPSERSDRPSYAIKLTNKHTTGSIPEYLHDLPKKTKHKAGYSPEDLRRESYVGG